MRSYEAICVFNPEIGEEKINSVISKIEEKIKHSKGEIVKVDKWGLKRLAYSPRKFSKVKEGFYAVVYFKSDGKAPGEVRDLIRVTEGIVLYGIAVSKSEAPREEKAPEEQKVEIASSMLEEPK